MVENITWKEIIESDIDQLQQHCDDFGLPGRGDESNLRERLLRHVLTISLPSGEIFLQGKININKASAEEMRLWPFMGETLIRNILEYREKYKKFYKIDDLMNVKGVGQHLFKKLVPFVDVSGKTHIKVMKDSRVEADLEFIKLEDEIRQKAWEIQDVRDHLNINMQSLGEMMTGVEDREKIISDNLKTMSKVEKKLALQSGKVNSIRKRMEKTYAPLKELETLKKKEIEELQAEKILLEEILPWKFIIKSDLEELQQHCEKYGLSPRGDKANLRDRLMRHILKINLPVGELLLEGKLNINTATSDEMSLWPYMGGTLVKNIIAYRQKYDKFYKIEDLMNVKGVGNNLFRKLVQFVDVAGKTHIKVKSGTRAEANMELIKLEDEIRNKAWELQDLKDHLEIDIDYLSDITKGLDEERQRIGENFGDIDDFQAKMEVKEKELQDLKDNLTNQIDELGTIKTNRDDELVAREQELDSKTEMLKEYEQKLNEIRYGVGANVDDMQAETVDLPVIVQRDPDDKNPEDDRVILDSTDGYIRRVINVYIEGQTLEGDYSRVVFKNIPLKKSYNILVDTGERRYFLMKNFNPGGAA